MKKIKIGDYLLLHKSIVPKGVKDVYSKDGLSKEVSYSYFGQLFENLDLISSISDSEVYSEYVKNEKDWYVYKKK